MLLHWSFVARSDFMIGFSIYCNIAYVQYFVVFYH